TEKMDLRHVKVGKCRSAQVHVVGREKSTSLGGDEKDRFAVGTHERANLRIDSVQGGKLVDGQLAQARVIWRAGHERDIGSVEKRNRRTGPPREPGVKQRMPRGQPKGPRAFVLPLPDLLHGIVRIEPQRVKSSDFRRRAEAGSIQRPQYVEDDAGQWRGGGTG